MDITDLLDRGGIIMGILLLLSVYVTAVLLYKIWQFISHKTRNTDFTPYVLDALQEGDAELAVRLTNESPNPIARIIEYTLDTLQNPKLSPLQVQEAISIKGAEYIRSLESHLRSLEMIATIAPLLGLLGTVLGMVRAFASLETAGTNVDPSLLAGGIWEALLTTVAGLAVAIPALAAHHILDGQIDQLRTRMEHTVSRILALVH